MKKKKKKLEKKIMRFDDFFGIGCDIDCRFRWRF